MVDFPFDFTECFFKKNANKKGDDEPDRIVGLIEGENRLPDHFILKFENILEKVSHVFGEVRSDVFLFLDPVEVVVKVENVELSFMETFHDLLCVAVVEDGLAEDALEEGGVFEGGKEEFYFEVGVAEVLASF